jgi:deoxycytidine triphosphate deaminase
VAILARDEIGERLHSTDPDRQIFRPDSWEDERVRGAAYDLRVAPDYLILPDGSRYWPDAPDEWQRARLASFEIAPGQVAFVSSAEKLWMPWDLAGNIAPKFRLALDGLLVMGGMLVDPGYGRFRRKGSSLVPCMEGERLHFQLANVGASSFTIVPNETSVAAIQFVEITGSSRKRRANQAEMGLDELKVPTSDRLLKDVFHPGASEPLPQLQFFFKTAEVRAQVADLERSVETNRIELDASEKSIDRIIVAGFFVILITIFGVAFAALVSAVTG